MMKDLCSHEKSSAHAAYISAALTHLEWLKLQGFSVDAWNTRLARSFQSHPLTCTLDKTTGMWAPKELPNQCGFGLPPLFNFAMAACLQDGIFESMRVCEARI